MLEDTIFLLSWDWHMEFCFFSLSASFTLKPQTSCLHSPSALPKLEDIYIYFSPLSRCQHYALLLSHSSVPKQSFYTGLVLHLFFSFFFFNLQIRKYHLNSWFSKDYYSILQSRDSYWQAATLRHCRDRRLKHTPRFSERDPYFFLFWSFGQKHRLQV